MRTAPTWRRCPTPPATAIPPGHPTARRSSFEDPGGIATINPDGTGKSVFGPGADPDWQPIPTGYARPKGATPLRVPLVISYKSCTAPNEQHGPRWSTPLFAAAAGVRLGHDRDHRLQRPGDPVRRLAALGCVPGNLSTPADEADVKVMMDITDVRRKDNLADYVGGVQATIVSRITDRFNAVAAGGGSDPATVVDIPFPVQADLHRDRRPRRRVDLRGHHIVRSDRAHCDPEGKRSIWQMGQVQVSDGGEDGNIGTVPNTMFAREGIFVP